MKLFILFLLFGLATLAPVEAQTSSVIYGSAPAPAPTPSAPIWAKLVVADNVVTAYCASGSTLPVGAAAPTNWIQIGAPQAISFVNNPLLVGIFLTSHNSATVSTGTIDSVSITPAATYELADVDVGQPKLMGSANLINGVWTMSGSGADVWNTSDQFNFQPWLVWGDCTIVCRITSLSAGSSWQKMGIMIRDGYNSGSAYAMVCATAGNGVSFQARLADNNNPDQQMLVAPPSPGVTASTTIGTDSLGLSAYVIHP